MFKHSYWALRPYSSQEKIANQIRHMSADYKGARLKLWRALTKQERREAALAARRLSASYKNGTPNDKAHYHAEWYHYVNLVPDSYALAMRGI